MEKKIYEGYIKRDGIGQTYILLFMKLKNGLNFSLPVSLSEKSERELCELLDSYGSELDEGLKIERRIMNPGRRIEDKKKTFKSAFKDLLKTIR